MLKKMMVATCAAFLLAAATGYAADAPMAKPMAPARAAVGAPAPDFTLPVMGGGDFMLSSLKDKKPVVIAVWQSACGTCVEDLKFLSGVMANSKAEFVAVNVDMRGGTADWNEVMKKYMADKNLSMKVLVDPKFSISKPYRVGATPSTILIKKDGTMAAMFTGFTPGESESVVSKAIAELN